jgi:hypothetical protein
MQPYWFPYIGYYQLFHAVDKFIFLDDANFIKKGWINRNRINSSGSESFITIPLAKASINRKINTIDTHDDDRWKKKITNTLVHAYAKAPYYQPVADVVEKSLSNKDDGIVAYASKSVASVLSYLDVPTVEIGYSSEIESTGLKGQDRIIQICENAECTTYINLSGGMSMYNKDDFEKRGIKLSFLSPVLEEYPQKASSFLPGLSILDVLMMNSPSEVRKFLASYQLV